MDTFDFLKKIPLFAGLAPDDLERLCKMVTEKRLPAGETLFSEGDHGDRAYVIQSGRLEILKNSGGRQVTLAVRQAGEVIGEMALLQAAPRFATVRARTDSLLLVIDFQHLDQLINTSPSAAKAMLHTVTARLSSAEQLMRQSERMAQLGTMTAGIAHELNNPAAAMGRGASQLQSAIARLQRTHWELARLDLSPDQTESLLSLDLLVRERALQPLDLDPLDRSDREGELEDWLASHAVPDSWELAPTLAGLGYDPDQLEELAAAFQTRQLPEVIRWLDAGYIVYGLLEEIVQGTARMSEIIKALKSYVYLDQAPIQEVDLHAGLDNTLVMLRGKLKGGIVVNRRYAPDLPRIMAYASELNQVWTNLIDNAVDAMDGRGELTIRTRQEGDWVIVEIQDNGPGIPADVQPKLFNPFFTTKPVGKGAGLGLNITYNIIRKHSGDIRVFSQPGETCFTVCLPLDFEQLPDGSLPPSGYRNLGDEDLRQILESVHTIAVVGISSYPDVPAGSVPRYLQSAGYHIIPVNPNLTAALGETAYPDLPSIPEPVDLVLVFRRSEYVPAIVDQAIEIGAKVVWMQDGIFNEAAARTAGSAGLQVVMNTCMRTTHQRLTALQ